MEEQNKRKSIAFLTIGIVTLIAIVVGATYAYFQTQSGNNVISNLNATTGTTDNLTFSTEGEIKINASADNFGENMGDQVSQASAIATLIPNNTSNHAEEKYNVYLVINENPFEYTNGEENPELILTITKDGGEYIKVQDLTIKNNITINTKGEGADLTSSTINGYDITTKRGLIKIAEGEDIIADNKTETDKWEIKIILRNLDKDQNKNTGKTFNGKIIIQKEEIPTKILDVCEPNDNIANCLIKLHDESEYGITKIVYHDEEEDYKGETNYELEAGDFSYRYSGSSEEVNNYVCFRGDCSNNPENENYANLYRIIGMFPTTATKDSENKEYQIKLIKADYATVEELGGKGVGAYYGEYSNPTSLYKGNLTYLTNVKSYYWNKQQNNTGNNTNDWSKSNLNTDNLNEYYLNEFIGQGQNINENPNKWQQMIEEHTWITAGNSALKIRTQNARTAYNNEIKNPAVGEALANAAQTYPAHVGLMYVSDYMYGASKEHWTKVGNDGNNKGYSGSKDDNWLYMGLDEYTITRNADYSYALVIIGDTGDVGSCNAYYNYGLVRPTMYLNPNVKITSGSGTGDDPYIITQ